MSGTNWQQPDHQPQSRGWGTGTKVAVALAGTLVGVGLGALATSLVDGSDDDSEQITETAETATTTTTTRPSTTTAPTTTAPPSPVVIPPDGYDQDQADAFSADLAEAVPEAPAEMHQSFLEIGAIECDMIDVDPEIGPSVLEAARSSNAGTISDALQANGMTAASAAELEEQVLSAAADATADHLCPEHAEHIRIDG